MNIVFFTSYFPVHSLFFIIKITSPDNTNKEFSRRDKVELHYFLEVLYQMFANPSKRVSCGDLELNVRFLVPASVICEALTSTQAAQVLNWLHCFISSIIHNHPVQLNPNKGVAICFIMEVFKESSFHLY